MTDLKTLVKEGKHFCILPWIHFHSWPDGKVMPCCVADSTKPVSHINKDESIIQMMNSEDYKNMRLSMLNDEPVDACKRCYDLEKVGVTTLRQSHNTNHGLSSIDLVETTSNDGEIFNFKLKYMDIRFSNLCNMKCRSCGPSCSSLWAQEFLEHRGVEVTQKHFGITKMVVNSNEDQIFMSKLKPYLADVHEVYFAGGEIVITPEHYECLDYWIENGLSKKIKLNYTTNFSVLKYKDRDLIGYWKKFPNLEIWASLDAQGSTAEIMRKGTDWDKVVENLKIIKEAVPHAKFQITPTISIWNIWQYPKFFDYLIENNLIDRTTAPRLNLLTQPWYANIMILPNHVREELQELYRDYIFKYCFNSELVANFRTVENALRHGNENKEGILEFKAFNEQLDEIRDESIIDIIPELKEIYKWAEN
jgi:hypothetical protein